MKSFQKAQNKVWSVHRVKGQYEILYSYQHVGLNHWHLQNYNKGIISLPWNHFCVILFKKSD